MDSYNKTNLRISGVIVWLSLIVGLCGYWLLHSYEFFEFAVVVIGLDFIVFSHDLAMEAVVKRRFFNYKFTRALYLLGRIIAIAATVISWKW